MTEQKDDLLAKRYGKKSANPRLFRLFAYLGIGALAMGTVLLGLANWSPIQSTTVGFRVISPWQTEVDFEIQMPPFLGLFELSWLAFRLLLRLFLQLIF